MARMICIFGLMVLTLPAFGHMTEDSSWHHLTEANRKAHHKDLHWHISTDELLETSWSRCVNQPGVYDESTGEYDFRKCDKEDPPANTEQTNPTPADAQEYDEYLESLEDDPVYVDGQDYQEYLDSIAPEPEPVPVSVRYSFDDFVLAKDGNIYAIIFGVRRSGSYTSQPEVTVSVSPKSHGGQPMVFSIRHRLPAPRGGSTITTRPLAGIISLALGRGDVQGASGTFIITATINEGSQTWTKSESLVWGQSAWIRSPPPDQKSTVKSETTEPEPTYANEDVNRDGVINNDDLTAIANNLGATPKGDIQHYDVDGDGDIDTADFQQVLNSVGANAAPAARSLTEPRLPQKELVEPLLVPGRIPRVTALLPNYPNPFNPETWIPYHLANDAEVVLTIYAADGDTVRRLELGHQTAGVYQSRAKAAYWDGRDALGFPVSSGVYFYTLSTGDFSATRKMLIAK